MRIIRVTYTVREEFVSTNKQNIEKVMSDLKAMNNPDIKYATFLEPDEKTFMHFAMYPNDETLQILQNLDSFNYFRKELKESMPEMPPKQVDLSLVASAYEIFKK